MLWLKEKGILSSVMFLKVNICTFASEILISFIFYKCKATSWSSVQVFEGDFLLITFFSPACLMDRDIHSLNMTLRWVSLSTILAWGMGIWTTQTSKVHFPGGEGCWSFKLTVTWLFKNDSLKESKSPWKLVIRFGQECSSMYVDYR